MSRGGLFAAGGRFLGGTDELMQKFNDSLPFDRRLWHADITGSKAYANALARSGIITTGAATKR
jgi:argininosuccinate lyase